MTTTLLLITTVVAAVRGLWSPCGLSMLSSLNPVAERARGNRFWVTAVWYVAGAAFGGAVLGAACAGGAALVAVAGASRTVVLGGAVALALLALASDLRVGGWRLPEHPRQVDERWLTAYRRWIYASGYGVQIGTGFATYVMTGAVYLVAGLAALTGRPAEALAVGVLFGVVRGSAILLAGRCREPGRLLALMAAVDRAAPWSIAAAAAASAAVAVGSAGLMGGPLAAGLLAAGIGVGVLAGPLRRRRSLVTAPTEAR